MEVQKNDGHKHITRLSIAEDINIIFTITFKSYCGFQIIAHWS